MSRATEELSVTGFLREVLEQHRTRPDHPFCWILGAGASVGSGIPTAGELARKFLACLCEDATGSRDQCDKWIESGALQIEGFDPLDPAKHYPELYEQRYGDRPDAGYAFLEEIMRDKQPSYGYAVLAHILDRTLHRIVITTNFDNLVADALSAHSTTFPRVVGHAELTQFVQTEVRRPLVAKIHGDLGFL
jgi:NAD-dependent SIR2 family protein deacetylase